MEAAAALAPMAVPDSCSPKSSTGVPKAVSAVVSAAATAAAAGAAAAAAAVAAVAAAAEYDSPSNPSAPAVVTTSITSLGLCSMRTVSTSNAWTPRPQPAAISSADMLRAPMASNLPWPAVWSESVAI
jgi:hypothetical protein